MLFNSYEFILLFLPITFFIYFYLNQKRLGEASKAFLVFASLFFYSYWNIAYLPIILSSMLFNFVIGTILNRKNTALKVNAKTLLSMGIVSNLALLGYFKYSDFFIENFNYTFNTELGLLHLALPLAISFFTFQQVAYLVDSYRGETKEYNFLNYALFVTFFPQLIAGPIVHHSEMMPQFSNRFNLVKNYKNITLGLFIFSIGLFKKVVIADTFAIWASNGFDKAESLNMIEAWASSLSYTFQLYYDFSGYTDMAIGVALLFNIKLPINFNSPYKAQNIQDFWRRWHITLSRFLKEYVYIPLGGNRVSELRIYTNLLATFILGGIWHGAGWTFMMWGFLHGIAVVIHRVYSKFQYKMSTLLAWFITFNFINISWVFFRAKEFDDAIKILKAMFLGDFMLDYHWKNSLDFLHVEYGPWLQNIYAQNDIFVWLFVSFVLVIFTKSSAPLLNSYKPSLFTLLWASLLTTYALLDMNKVTEFLYFNF